MRNLYLTILTPNIWYPVAFSFCSRSQEKTRWQPCYILEKKGVPRFLENRNNQVKGIPGKLFSDRSGLVYKYKVQRWSRHSST